jgi:O-antigen/teichoic acid export membrane protein
MVASTVVPAAFAIYAVGCFQLPLVDLLYTPTSEVLMVQLGELEKAGRLQHAAEAFRQAAARLAFVFLPLAAFLFAAAPEFIGAVFGAKFLEAVPIFRVCVLGIPLAILPMDGALRARNQTGHIFRSYLVKAAVTVPLVYFGVKAFGMLGGIGAWATAELVGKAMLLSGVPTALSTDTFRLRVADVIPWPSLFRAAVAAVTAAAGVIVVRSWEPLSPATGTFWVRLIPLALAGALYGLCYLAMLRVVGVRAGDALGAVLRRRAPA